MLSHLWIITFSLIWCAEGYGIGSGDSGSVSSNPAAFLARFVNSPETQSDDYEDYQDEGPARTGFGYSDSLGKLLDKFRDGLNPGIGSTENSYSKVPKIGAPTRGDLSLSFGGHYPSPYGFPLPLFLHKPPYSHHNQPGRRPTPYESHDENRPDSETRYPNANEYHPNPGNDKEIDSDSCGPKCSGQKISPNPHDSNSPDMVRTSFPYNHKQTKVEDNSENSEADPLVHSKPQPHESKFETDIESQFPEGTQPQNYPLVESGNNTNLKPRKNPHQLKNSQPTTFENSPNYEKGSVISENQTPYKSHGQNEREPTDCGPRCEIKSSSKPSSSTSPNSPDHSLTPIYKRNNNTSSEHYPNEEQPSQYANSLQRNSPKPGRPSQQPTPAGKAPNRQKDDNTNNDSFKPERNHSTKDTPSTDISGCQEGCSFPDAVSSSHKSNAANNENLPSIDLNSAQNKDHDVNSPKEDADDYSEYSDDTELKKHLPNNAAAKDTSNHDHSGNHPDSNLPRRSNTYPPRASKPFNQKPATNKNTDDVASPVESPQDADAPNIPNKMQENKPNKRTPDTGEYSCGLRCQMKPPVQSEDFPHNGKRPSYNSANPNTQHTPSESHQNYPETNSQINNLSSNCGSSKCVAISNMNRPQEKPGIGSEPIELMLDYPDYPQEDIDKKSSEDYNEETDNTKNKNHSPDNANLAPTRGTDTLPNSPAFEEYPVNVMPGGNENVSSQLGDQTAEKDTGNPDHSGNNPDSNLPQRSNTYPPRASKPFNQKPATNKNTDYVASPVESPQDADAPNIPNKMQGGKPNKRMPDTGEYPCGPRCQMKPPVQSEDFPHNGKRPSYNSANPNTQHTPSESHQNYPETNSQINNLSSNCGSSKCVAISNMNRPQEKPGIGSEPIELMLDYPDYPQEDIDKKSSEDYNEETDNTKNKNHSPDNANLAPTRGTDTLPNSPAFEEYPVNVMPGGNENVSSQLGDQTAEKDTGNPDHSGNNPDSNLPQRSNTYPPRASKPFNQKPATNKNTDYVASPVESPQDADAPNIPNKMQGGKPNKRMPDTGEYPCGPRCQMKPPVQSEDFPHNGKRPSYNSANPNTQHTPSESHQNYPETNSQINNLSSNCGSSKCVAISNMNRPQEKPGIGSEPIELMQDYPDYPQEDIDKKSSEDYNEETDNTKNKNHSPDNANLAPTRGTDTLPNSPAFEEYPVNVMPGGNENVSSQLGDQTAEKDTGNPDHSGNNPDSNLPQRSNTYPPRASKPFNQKPATNKNTDYVASPVESPQDADAPNIPNKMQGGKPNKRMPDTGEYPCGPRCQMKPPVQSEDFPHNGKRPSYNSANPNTQHTPSESHQNYPETNSQINNLSSNCGSSKCVAISNMNRPQEKPGIGSEPIELMQDYPDYPQEDIDKKSSEDYNEETDNTKNKNHSPDNANLAPTRGTDTLPNSPAFEEYPVNVMPGGNENVSSQLGDQTAEKDTGNPDHSGNNPDSNLPQRSNTYPPRASKPFNQKPATNKNTDYVASPVESPQDADAPNIPNKMQGGKPNKRMPDTGEYPCGPRCQMKPPVQSEDFPHNGKRPSYNSAHPNTQHTPSESHQNYPETNSQINNLPSNCGSSKCVAIPNMNRPQEKPGIGSQPMEIPQDYPDYPQEDIDKNSSEHSHDETSSVLNESENNNNTRIPQEKRPNNKLQPCGVKCNTRKPNNKAQQQGHNKSPTTNPNIEAELDAPLITMTMLPKTDGADGSGNRRDCMLDKSCNQQDQSENESTCHKHSRRAQRRCLRRLRRRNRRKNKNIEKKNNSQDEQSAGNQKSHTAEKNTGQPVHNQCSSSNSCRRDPIAHARPVHKPKQKSNQPPPNPVSDDTSKESAESDEDQSPSNDYEEMKPELPLPPIDNKGHQNQQSDEQKPQQSSGYGHHQKPNQGSYNNRRRGY